MSNYKDNNFAQRTNGCLKKKQGKLGRPEFLDMRGFVVCGGVFCTLFFCMIGVYFLACCFSLLKHIVVYLKSGSRHTCFCIFLHFRKTHRRVPKIGFSADVFIDMFMCISIGIFIGISIAIELTFIDKEEEERN